MAPHEQPKNMAHLLFEVARLMGRRLRTHFEGTGLHRGQAFLLGRLLHGDGIPQSELARDVHLRAPMVTRMLARMEHAG
ncbi:MAG: MarR family transcriptional regulator, partial [Candidatus Bipolaricaulota bacterium]